MFGVCNHEGTTPPTASSSTANRNRSRLKATDQSGKNQPGHTHVRVCTKVGEGPTAASQHLQRDHRLGKHACSSGSQPVHQLLSGLFAFNRQFNSPQQQVVQDGKAAIPLQRRHQDINNQVAALRQTAICERLRPILMFCWQFDDGSSVTSRSHLGHQLHI